MAGQPTKYKPEYCDAIRNWFENYEWFTTETVTENVGGKLETFNKKFPNRFPSLVTFARSINVSRSVLNEWAQKYPEFLQSLNDAKEIIENNLVTLGLSGHYNANMVRFAATNYTGMRETQVIEHQGDANFNFNIIKVSKDE